MILKNRITSRLLTFLL